MTITVEIDGRQKACPAQASNLEELLSHLMVEELDPQTIVVEVKVDGETYSEGYPHQARGLPLGGLGHVEVRTLDRTAFAEEFLGQLPDHIEHVRLGIERAVGLLRDPGACAAGHDLLALSLAALQALFRHMEQVRTALAHTRVLPAAVLPWESFGDISDRILGAQRAGDPLGLAGVLENGMLPWLVLWRRGVSALVH